MLSAAEVQAEIIQVQPGATIETIPLPGRGRARPELEVRQGVAPDGSPLADPSIDLFVVTKGIDDSDPHKPPKPRVVGRVAVEHTPGEAPAVVDARAQLLDEENVVNRALPTMLKRARVRQARLLADRINGGVETIRRAGLKEDSSGSVLVTAA